MIGMKQFILLAAMMTASIAYASEPNDTITVNNAHKVTIVNSDSMLQVEVNGKDGKPGFHYMATLRNTDGNYESSSMGGLFNFSIVNKFGKNKKRQPRYDSNLHVFFGFNGAAGNDDVVNTNMWQGINIGTYIDWGVNPWRDGHRFSAGIGLEWKNYRMTSRKQFVKADNGNVTVEPLGENVEPKFSRIKTFSLIFPIMYSYQQSDWGFSLGPVINCTTHSSIKTRYKVNGEKHKDKYKDLHPSAVTVDIMGTIITPWLLNFYVKYNPCDILDTEYGPKFHSLSVGFMI